jgi:hypothetical protein
MSQDDSGAVFGRDRKPDTRLVRQINRALADSGLRVRTARKGSLTEDLAGPYYVVYGKRAFQLRIEINELARALGVESPQTASRSAEQATLAKQVANRLFANTLR